jgi:uncharacterized protein (DUF58 family)
VSPSLVDVLGRARTPAEPGPGPLSNASLRALDLAIGRRVDGMLAGDFRSAFAGIGAELNQIRPYVPGDDVRRIDWNVTARTGEPHVRVEFGERVLVTWIVVDLSASMRFGTADRRKTDVAEGVSIAIGHVATRRGNELGVVALGGDELLFRRPRQGRLGLLLALGALRETPVGGGSLSDALRLVDGLAINRSLVVVISDFRGPIDWRPELLRVAARHRTLAVEVRDPREQQLADVGEVRLEDPETGLQLLVDTEDTVLREQFAAAAAEERQALVATLTSCGVPHVVLSTEGDWLRPLGRFLRSDRA